MAGKEEVAEELSKWMNRNSKQNGFLNLTKGIAVDINEVKKTFTLQRDGEADIPNVGLNAYSQTTGHILIIPAEKSVVVVGMADNEEDAFIVEASEVVKIVAKIGEFEISIDKDVLKSKNTDSELTQNKDSIEIKKGSINLEINANEAKFNGGLLAGLVKLGALVSKLNAIENKVNNLTNSFNSHKHSAVGTSISGGAVTITTGGMTPPNSVSSGTLTNTTNSDLENPKVKQ